MSGKRGIRKGSTEVTFRGHTFYTIYPQVAAAFLADYERALDGQAVDVFRVWSGRTGFSPRTGKDWIRKAGMLVPSDRVALATMRRKQGVDVDVRERPLQKGTLRDRHWAKPRDWWIDEPTPIKTNPGPEVRQMPRALLR